MTKRRLETDADEADEQADAEDGPTKISGTMTTVSSTSNHPQMVCTLPPTCILNPAYFANQDSFELHYQTQHTNICLTCHKNFPNERLLDIHIIENHDPFTKIKLQRGESIYQCFVSGCERAFSTHKKRRLHLVDKHDYPKDFLFSVVDRGIRPNQSSLIKRHTREY